LDLVQYYSEIIFQVQSARADGGFSKDIFSGIAVDLLEGYEELSDARQAQFESVNQNRKKIGIDGYAFDEVDKSLSAVISIYSESESLETLTQTELMQAFETVESFIVFVTDDRNLGRLESSSAGAQAALDIRHHLQGASKIRLFVVTNKLLSNRVKSLPVTTVAGKEAERYVWDIQRFHDLYLSGLSHEELNIDLREYVPSGLPSLKYEGASDGSFSTYLTVIPGRVVAEIYNSFGSRLLEGNVRSFLSARGNVNKGIRQTILSAPEEFLAYNNGLSTTATGIVEDSGGTGIVYIKEIKGFQIVNGGQTTVTLSNFLRQERERLGNLDHVNVQMKLTCVDPTEVGELVPKIAEYANTQNKVSATDFFSNSPFHVRMQEISRRLVARPKQGMTTSTKWYYERARGSYLNDKSRLGTKALMDKFDREFPRGQVIDKAAMAKVYNCWDMKPNVVSKGAKNFVEFAGQVANQYESESGRNNFADDFYKK